MRIISSLFISLAAVNYQPNAIAAPTPLTPQTAEYQVNYGEIELGKGKYELPKSVNGIYKYRFDSSLSLLLLTDIRHVVSEFSQDGNQLQPQTYLHEREGVGAHYSEQTTFVKDQRQIYTRYKAERAKFPFEANVFDPLMVQLQFRLDISAGKELLDYKMVKDNEVDEYQFRVLGKERMTIESGSYETVKIEVIRDEKKSKKRQTFFWMAPELAYLPVRLTHFEKGSKQLDIKLLSYHFDDTQQGTQTATEAEKVAQDTPAQ